ncbi:hypothetical protein Tco_1131966 [Tanacetum coccineum]|uniref:Uncharacterized protein n=1 Tax=Tanacetum coccineum TaxID=301880 RepID=A0ABQ5JAJ4_9ASTR
MSKLRPRESSDNEDAETRHWKSKNKYREDEDEDMSRPWRRQKETAEWSAIPAKLAGFEELRRAFRLNFTQRKKCAKNLVELAGLIDETRQGGSPQATKEERFKDEMHSPS